MKKKIIIFGLVFLLFAIIVIAVNRQQENIIHDFGIETQFDQAVGHHYRPYYDIELYAGYKTKEILFNVEFENTPTIICKCYQDDNLFRWYAGQLECEATEITTEGFRGTCHYKVNTEFRKENNNIYIPKDVSLHWTADDETTPNKRIMGSKK